MSDRIQRLLLVACIDATLMFPMCALAQGSNTPASDGQQPSPANAGQAVAASKPDAGGPPSKDAVKPSSAKIKQLDLIVVTADKREQKLFDVPMSISAVSDQEITSRGATSIEDLKSSVPGLSISEFSPGQQRVSLRGVSDYSGLPTVGVYLDELPLDTENSGAGMDTRLIDMRRIEVLRGPQGTLYGQGAMGGTIRYITNDPDPSGFDGMVSGDTGLVRGGGTDGTVNGMVNIPISNDIAVRFAGGYQHFGGWIDDPALGKKDINSGNTHMLRGKLLWQVSDNFKISLLAQHQNLSLGSDNESDSHYQNYTRVPATVDQSANLFNLVATYDFANVTLLSSTGYIDRHDQTANDISNSLIPLLELPPPYGFGYPAGTFQSVAVNQDAKNDIFTQEFRLASRSDGPFRWTVGTSYRDANNSGVTQTVAEPNILPFEPIHISGTSPEDSRSWAVFGEATYKLTSTWDVTVGGRYFHDLRRLNSLSSTFGTTSIDSGSSAFHAFSPKFNLNWRLNDQTNLYFNASKGFRSGGFNVTSVGLGRTEIPPTFGPDSLWTYELGAKYHSADNMFTADFAVYQNNWSNVQTLTTTPNSVFTFTSNGGKLSGQGVDAALTFRPNRYLSFMLTGGYNNMTYRSNTADHLKGDPADYDSRFTGSASVEYRLDVSATGQAFARLDYQHTDGYQIFVRTTQLAPVKSDDVNLWNARIGLDESHWELSLFARNILGTRAITYPAFGSLIYPIRVEPRVVGIEGTLRY